MAAPHSDSVACKTFRETLHIAICTHLSIIRNFLLMFSPSNTTPFFISEHTRLICCPPCFIQSSYSDACGLGYPKTRGSVWGIHIYIPIFGHFWWFFKVWQRKLKKFEKSSKMTKKIWRKCKINFLELVSINSFLVASVSIRVPKCITSPVYILLFNNYLIWLQILHIHTKQVPKIK